MKFHQLACRFCSVLCLGALITGCAVGNTYNYAIGNTALPVKGEGEISVGVVDAREYVLSGNKDPNFVGLQRGGFGNPFDVTTTSGNPMAEDMTQHLANALTRAGFDVTEIRFSSPDNAVILTSVKQSALDKNVVLRVREWKTDAMMKFRLIYDIDLSVLDESGVMLASISDRGDEVISGAGFESANSQLSAATFGTKISRMFNNPEIRAALTN